MFTFVYKKRPLRIYEDYEFEGDGRRKKRHRVKIKKGNKTRFVKINIDDYKKIGKIKKVKVNKAFAKDNASQFQPIITGNKIRDLQLSSLMNSGNTTNTVYQVTKDIENKLNQQTQNIDKELKLIQDKINKGEVLDIKDLLVDDFAQDIYKEVLNKYPNDEKEANKEFLNVYKKQLVNFKDDLKIKEDEAKKLEEDLIKNKDELDKNKRELSIKKVQNFITSIIKDKRFKQKEEEFDTVKKQNEKLSNVNKETELNLKNNILEYTTTNIKTPEDLSKLINIINKGKEIINIISSTNDKNYSKTDFLTYLGQKQNTANWGRGRLADDDLKMVIDKLKEEVKKNNKDFESYIVDYYNEFINKKPQPRKEEQKKEEPKPKKEDKQSTPKRKIDLSTTQPQTTQQQITQPQESQQQKTQPQESQQETTGEQGKGIKQEKGLSHEDLYNIVEPYKKEMRFMGVFTLDDAIDYLDNTNNNNFSMIINLLTSKELEKYVGHFVALNVNYNEGYIEYYDSFAKNPPRNLNNSIHKYIKRIFDDEYTKFKINNVKQQSVNSSNCGWFVVEFLYKRRVLYIPFKYVTKYHTIKKNESNIEKFKKKFKYI